jgi:RNA polymerase sigma-70 factor (ECF subfamily)
MGGLLPASANQAALIAASAGTDIALLHKLQAGDNVAWTELTHEYSPRLYAYLRRNLPSAVDAEDALSETLLAAVRAMPNFDGRVSLSAFLYALAYRKMADFWRRQLETLAVSDSGVGGSDRSDFEEALDTLPELLRHVLLLRYEVGLSVTEVAEVIDRSYKGAESLLSRARSQLRVALDKMDVNNE